MIAKFKESSTFKLVVASWAILNYQWLFGGVAMTAIEYGAATAAILGIWLGREWKEKHYSNG
jgi:hypothetical protein